MQIRKLKIKNIINKQKILVFIFLSILNSIFFYKIFLGLIPIPLDALVGGYWPWLDYKWGYDVGVPVANPSLSDVFSQLYPWRIIALDQIKQGTLPLWNPYSFSGTPLLANWQSAAFYPFNFLIILFGNIWGWSLLVFLQPLLASFFTYLFLNEKKFSTISSVIGGIIFAYSGFMLTYLEYATAGHVFLYFPLLLFVIEKYFNTNIKLWLIWIPFICFFAITAGFFQPVLYLFVITFFYIIFKINFKKISGYQIRKILLVQFFLILGLTLSAVQLIPVIELVSLSFRSVDKNIIEYSYGLLPIKNLITFLAPDFFGNPATFNFWGVIGYQETSGYFGIIPLIIVFSLILSQFQDKKINFWSLVFLISIVFLFDNPISKLVYKLNLPLISTSFASRILLCIGFAGAILTAMGIENLAKLRSKIIFLIIIVLAILVLAELFLVYITTYNNFVIDSELVSNFKVSVRNLILPILILSISLGFLLRVRNVQIIKIFLLVIILLDLFRFGLKFTPFSKKDFFYPVTPVISYLQQNAANYRIEREKSEVMPPNTWAAYKLMSPSGYDPLYTKQYSSFYNVYNLGSPNFGYSRYAELQEYNSPFLDLAGVKYLLVAKRDQENKIDKLGGVSLQILDPKYRQVFEDRGVIVLENTKVVERAKLFTSFDFESDNYQALNKLHLGYDFRNKVILNENPNILATSSASGSAKIVDYQANRVKVAANHNQDSILVLSDTYYPGWEVWVDGIRGKILIANGIFKAVALNKGKHSVEFTYNSKSFKIGLYISLTTLLIIILLFFCIRKKVI